MIKNKRILVIGGSRFFGKRLVTDLLAQGNDVVVMNRGNLPRVHDEVEQVICDRNDTEKMQNLLGKRSWDVVFDQVCFDYSQAKAACEVFSGQVGKYIFTSTGSVYDNGSFLKEENFDPTKYEFATEVSRAEDYGEAKRQAEVAFVRHADFPVTMVRFPIVFGKDDYTKRFLFHFDGILNGRPVFFPNLEARKSFVESSEAASTLSFLAGIDHVGPVNVASPEPIVINSLMALIEKFHGKSLKLLTSYNKENHSPYGIEEDWFMDCGKLESLGLKLSPLEGLFNKYMKSLV